MKKKPVQSRSCALVKSVIDCMDLLLAEHKIEDITIEHIVVKSGVSSGSIYQYFTNKDSIYKASIKRINDTLMKIIEKHEEHINKKPFKQWAIDLLSDVYTYLYSNNKIYIKIIRNCHESDFILTLDTIEYKLTKILREHINKTNNTNTEILIYIITKSLISTTTQYIRRPNPLIDMINLIEKLSEIGEILLKDKDLALNTIY